MFITALFTIAKNWNQPKFPSMIDWIMIDWICVAHIHHGILKKDEFTSFAGT